jgi:hypothetical protein
VALGLLGGEMKVNQIDFEASPSDAQAIREIVKRAVVFNVKNGGPRVDPLDLNMDLTATHLNGCPLKLQELLEADDFNLIHDVFGIHRHLDRNTGKLKNCFLPRFAKN